MSLFPSNEQLKSAARYRRRALRLPYTALQILQDGLEEVREKRRRDAVFLPMTRFEDEVNHYRGRQEALPIEGPRPQPRDEISMDQAEDLALRIDAALDLLQLSRNADPLIKPVLLYYSCAYLCGVYCDAYLEWTEDRRTHGMHCKSSESGDVGDTLIHIHTGGLLPRLATTLFLLNGLPTCFSTLVTYTAKPEVLSKAEHVFDTFGEVEDGEPKRDWKLGELAWCNYDELLRPVRERHGFRSMDSIPSASFLVDVLTLFMSSCLARYHISTWRAILQGRDSPYRLHFEETFDRFADSAVDILLLSIAHPQFELASYTTFSGPGPYASAHPRFRQT